jgi:hypothetical protein
MEKIPPLNAAPAPVRPPLTIPLPEFRSRVTHLFREVTKDKSLQDIFMRNPTRVLSEWVLHEELPEQQSADWNHLLFAMLSNDAFLAWANDYSVKHAGKRLDRNAFAREFAMKVLELGDKTLLGSVLKSVAAGHGLPGIDNAARLFVCNNAARTCFVVPVAQDQKAESSQNFESRMTSEQSATATSTASTESSSNAESSAASSSESATGSASESQAQSESQASASSDTASSADTDAGSQTESSGIERVRGWDMALMRAVTEQLVAYAHALRDSGELARAAGGFER